MRKLRRSRHPSLALRLSTMPPTASRCSPQHSGEEGLSTAGTPGIAKTARIGAWSDDDFVNAFWEGISPEGDHYYPAFPYTSYTGVSRADLLAMKAYLFSLEPVARDPLEHDLAWYISTRLAAGAWKLTNFDAARFVPDPGESKQWNRGAYLVRHLGHCGECHTPRGRLGALQYDSEFAGNPNGPTMKVFRTLPPTKPMELASGRSAISSTFWI